MDVEPEAIELASRAIKASLRYEPRYDAEPHYAPSHWETERAARAALEALVANGYRLCSPNMMLLPKDANEARAMNAISERYLELGIKK